MFRSAFFFGKTLTKKSESPKNLQLVEDEAKESEQVMIMLNRLKYEFKSYIDIRCKRKN